MTDLEIPLGRRTKKYRFFEMLPAVLSYGAIIIFIILSLLSPLLAAIYLITVIVTLLIKAIGIAFHTIRGRNWLDRAQKVNWNTRLKELEDPKISFFTIDRLKSKEFGIKNHFVNVQQILDNPKKFPKPSQIYNAVIIATFNESYDILVPTLNSIVKTTYDKNHLIVIIAYEERGGENIEKTVQKLKNKFSRYFFAFELVKHPKNIENEVIGKGSNITFAGKYLKNILQSKHIGYKNVIVTTLDSDNRPHRTYFDYLTYEYIVNENRKYLSYQPVSLFLNNIWDAPAPMRVVATGNTFWNIISSMRPHTLRNFASHSQPMDSLVEMNFWSTRTIVEDGHQYWRSYFHFKGNYEVVPLYIPIYQDAVLSDTYFKTLKAQFYQLRRWAYGASDIPYVAVRIFSKDRNVPLFESLGRFFRLVDGHVTLASVSILVAFGGWVPLYLNPDSSRDPIAHQLPEIISFIHRLATVGLLVTVYSAFKLLPPRPKRYKKHRTIFMIFQWLLMPITAIGYSSFSALYSQGRLFTGKYLDKFDVTDKATYKQKQKR